VAGIVGPPVVKISFVCLQRIDAFAAQQTQVFLELRQQGHARVEARWIGEIAEFGGHQYVVLAV
jgi:hypothetical protein